MKKTNYIRGSYFDGTKKKVEEILNRHNDLNDESLDGKKWYEDDDTFHDWIYGGQNLKAYTEGEKQYLHHYNIMLQEMAFQPDLIDIIFVRSKI